LDVVVGGKYSGNDVIEVRLGNGNGTFGPPNVFPTVLDMGLGNPSQAFRAADFNGDGKLDLLGISGESELVTLPGKVTAHLGHLASHRYQRRLVYWMIIWPSETSTMMESWMLRLRSSRAASSTRFR